jgi:hypothetical protein
VHFLIGFCRDQKPEREKPTLARVKKEKSSKENVKSGEERKMRQNGHCLLM